MSRKFVAVVLPLAVLAAVFPRAAAGPPEGASGRMVFQRDDVADGLRKYRKEKDVAKRLLCLMKLAPTRDPRVAVTLGEALESNAVRLARRPLTKEEEEWGIGAEYLLENYFLPPLGGLGGQGQIDRVHDWWNEHEADLRRRASQLPR